MKAKLSDLVRLPSGEVFKLSDLIDRGEIEFSKSENFYKRGGGIRVAYFADHVPSGYCVEINRMAYEYRTAGATRVNGEGRANHES